MRILKNYIQNVSIDMLLPCRTRKKTIGWSNFAFPGIELPMDGAAQYIEAADSRCRITMKVDNYQ